MGDPTTGDYWIDCHHISQKLLSSLFGFWISIVSFVISWCIRRIYTAHVRCAIFESPSSDKHAPTPTPSSEKPEIDPMESSTPSNKGISLWRVSAPSSLGDLIQCRTLVIQTLKGRSRDYAFLITALTCLFAFIVSSSATAITSYSIKKNPTIRDEPVAGRLVNQLQISLSPAPVNITATADALDDADAPWDQLFDFVPEVQGWIWDDGQWNNSWRGVCRNETYEGVTLDLFETATNDYAFQRMVPGLREYLPGWVNMSTPTAGDLVGPTTTVDDNTTRFDAVVALFVFGNSAWLDPVSSGNNTQRINISLVNFLGINVPEDQSTGNFLNTTITTDVEVVDCTYTSTDPLNPNVAYPNLNLGNAILNIESVFERSLSDAVAAGLPVEYFQPDGEDMIRWFQAYQLVKDTVNPNYVQRSIAVLKPRLQIRLTALVVPPALVLLAILWTLLAVRREKKLVKDAWVPSSALDWMVVSAREHFHHGEGHEAEDAVGFVKMHEGLRYGVVGERGALGLIRE